MNKPISQYDAVKMINKFNLTKRVGDKVQVRQDDGSVKEWTIKAQADLLGGHTPVAWFEEKSGAYSLERVIL